MEASSFRRRAPGHAYDFLPPEPAVRRPRAPRPVDVSDAEFVIIDSARPQGSAARVARSPALLSSALYAAEAWLQRASLRTFAALAVTLFILVFGLAGGFAGLSGPDAASTAPLHFTHVTVTPRDANGMRILLINGIIENEGGTTQTVRPIRADLVADERLTASIVIEPPTDVIYAGQSRGFSARLQHAGGKVPEVRLSFMP